MTRRRIPSSTHTHTSSVTHAAPALLRWQPQATNEEEEVVMDVVMVSLLAWRCSCWWWCHSGCGGGGNRKTRSVGGRGGAVVHSTPRRTPQPASFPPSPPRHGRR